MSNLTFLGFTNKPQNIFWFIVENGVKTAHHCNGCGLYVPNRNAPNGNYHQIDFDALVNFPEVQAYIQSKL